MIRFLIIFLMVFNFIFSEKYEAKNIQEQKILEKFKNKPIKLGVYNNNFLSGKFNDKDSSINDLVSELFNDYLGLNFELISNNHSDLYNEYINNHIDGIALVNRTKTKNEKFTFSDTIMDIELYVVSNEVTISSIEDLDNKVIYSNGGSISLNRAKEIFKNYDLEVTIKEVNDIALYKNEIILTYFPVYYKPKYGIKIGDLLSISIGLDKKFDELIPIINNAINEKYREAIAEKIRKNEIILSKKNFMELLTKEELDYLKTLKNINIGYGDEYSILAYFSEKNNSYQGSIPNVMSSIGKRLNININPIPLKLGNQISDLNSKKVDIVIGSKNKSNLNNFIFSKRISEVPIYQIKNKFYIENKGIGVVFNSLEEDVAYNYESLNNIKKYDSYTALYDALYKEDVRSIIVTNFNNFDSKKYDINLLELKYSNLMYRKENYLLKSIIDKSFGTLIPIKLILKDALIEKKNEESFLIKKQRKDKERVETFLQLLIFLLIILFIKIKFDASHKKKLLKDPLSQLHNRIVFNKFCNSKSSNLKGYTLIIDFDNFKEVNDAYGHETGDIIISEFSGYLRNNFNSKTIFRISGDEFYGVIDKNFEDIIKILKDYKTFCPTMKMYNATFSTGIYRKNLNSRIKKDFKYTDKAMFEAKKTKGFSYKLADTEFIKRMKREEKILTILNGNLNEIYPVFQPKIDLNTNIVIGAEALARCLSHEFGMIYPLEFIGVAETYNIVHRIDYKIAEESIKTLKEKITNSKLNDDFRISFNISVNTFKRKDLVETIENLLTKYDVSGKYLEVEITESIFITDIKDIINKLDSLNKLGIQLSLDDFTAGHSTAGILPFLPLTIVKLDKSLLDSFNQNRKRGKIVYLNMITLVKELDLKIVAEGIETKEELEFLRKAGVDYGQGYFIGRPALLDDITIL